MIPTRTQDFQAVKDTHTIRLARPPHEQRRAKWQDTPPPTYQEGPLSPQQVEDFYKDGLLVLPDFYTLDQIKACQRDMDNAINELADTLLQAKRITHPHLHADDNDKKKLDWTERLLSMAKEDPQAPIFLLKRGILPPSFWNLYSHPQMLQIAQQLGLTSHLALHPAWNIRAKMPHDPTTVVPWHQDNSYWEPRLWDELILTVWVALVPASVQNGCLQFVKSGHASGKTATHTIGTSSPMWYTELDPSIMEQELEIELKEEQTIVTCEASPGTAIIFGGTLPHRSLNSMEASVRWSTDFRLHNAVPRRKTLSGRELDWFYGMKDSLVLTPNDTTDKDNDNENKINNTKPTRQEWEQWAGMDRTQLQDETAGVAAMEFDPVVVGPWMDLWTMEHHKDGLNNPHVDRYLETLALKGGNDAAVEAEDAKLIQGYKDNGNW